MPNEQNTPYSLAKKKEDSMKGVTDPERLLKADTQRIDKNIYDPGSPDYAKRPGAQETIQKI